MAKYGKLILLVLFLSTFIVPVLAADTTPLSQTDIGAQFTSAMKLIFGTPQASDTFVWLRFAVFVLGLLILASVVTVIPLFKDKPEIGALAAAIIAFIAVRLMPDASLATIVIFIPALFVVAIAVMAFQILKSPQLATAGMGKLKGVMIFGTVIVTLGVLWQMMTPIATEIPEVTQSPFWPWWITIISLGLVASVIGLAITVYSGFGKKLRKAFRSDEKKSAEELSELKTDFNSMRTIEQLEIAEERMAKTMAATVDQLAEAVAKDNWPRAIFLLEELKRILIKELEDLNEELTLSRNINIRLQDVKQKIAALERNDKSKKQEEAANLQTQQLDAHLQQLEAYRNSVDKYLRELEDGALVAINRCIVDLQAGKYDMVRQYVPYLKSMLQRLEGTVYKDLKASQQFEQITLTFEQKLKNKENKDILAIKIEKRIDAFDKLAMENAERLKEYVEKTMANMPKKNVKQVEKELTAIEKLLNTLQKSPNPRQRALDLSASENDLKAIMATVKNNPVASKYLNAIWAELQEVSKLLAEEAAIE